MREMKFRVWDNKRKKMLYSGDKITESGGCNNHFPVINLNGNLIALCNIGQGTEKGLIYEGYYARVGFDWKLMQYTGLKDKNGKEIYEDDIVKLENKSGDTIRIVLYFPRCQGYVFAKNQQSKRGMSLATLVNKDRFFEDDKYMFCEKIGNIHQHPKLLKGDQNGTK